LGILYGLSASFFISVMSACVKMTSYYFFLLVATRSALQIVLLHPIIIYQQIDIRKSFRLPQAYFVFGRAIAETISVSCQFYAYQNMNIGDAAAIIYSSPFITGILAAIFLKEKFTLFNLLATIVSFGGVILVSKPPFIFGSGEGDGTQTNFGVAGIAFCGAICTSIAILNVRKIGNSVDTYVLTYYFSIVCCIVPLIITGITGSFELPPCGSRRLLLLTIGLLGFLGHLSFVKAIQLEEAMLVAVIRTVDVLFGYVLEITVFGTTPSILSIIGAFLVVSS
ncbi:uncharacterized protein TRIADDRAFT_15077, partial [Trichoplax adhaerens]